MNCDGTGDCCEDCGMTAPEQLYGSGTHRENFFRSHNLSPSFKPSLTKVAKISGVPIKILQEVYNRGIGAYKTQPTSVRLKGSYVKNVNAPMKKKLSKEQWAWARVYSFLDGNPKHDNDLRKNTAKVGGGSTTSKQMKEIEERRVPNPVSPRQFAVEMEIEDYIKNHIPNWETYPEDILEVIGNALHYAIDNNLQDVRLFYDDEIYNPDTKKARVYLKASNNPNVEYFYFVDINNKKVITGRKSISNEEFNKISVKEWKNSGRSGGSLKGFSNITRATLQKMAQDAYKPKGANEIDGYKLIHTSPTIKFFKKDGEDAIIVAIRGTKTSQSKDLYADANLVIGNLENTERFLDDDRIMNTVQRHYPPTDYDYYGVGHSLGGAILDQFILNGNIKSGISYNPAVNMTDVRKHIPNHRIYSETDPLYAIYKNLLIDKPEVRPTKDPIWIQFGKYSGGITALASYIYSWLQSHKIQEFEGGGSGGVAPTANFRKQLLDAGIKPETYLKEARLRAKAHGYPYKLLGFADDGVHKLAIPNHSGSIRRFGRISNNDFIIYSHLERLHKVDKGTAEKKKAGFHNSHTKIKGEWRKDDFSPNNLALRILW